MPFSSTPIPVPAAAGLVLNVDAPPDEGSAAALTGLPPFDGTLPFFPFGPPAMRSPVDPPREADGRKRNVVFCWELGGGLGHMMQMLLLATDL